MPSSDLSSEAIRDLVGTRHAVTGIEFAPAGLQPYHEWLMRTLFRLAENSAGAFRVAQADQNFTSICVASGRASISDVTLTLEETTIDLATFNNDTALIWLEDDAGVAQIGTAASTAGWPAGVHLKLAEVTLAAGTITSILDRRFETLFRI